MRSTATELGTPSNKVSSLQSSAWTPWNHVFHVASESCARTAAATLDHRSSAAGVPKVGSPISKPVVHRTVHTCGEAAPTRREALSSALASPAAAGSEGE